MIPRLGMGEEDHGPPWLRPLLKADYFIPCQIHGVSGKSECNMYCLDCVGEDALCSYCLSRHEDHHVVQIRRSSYHNVIRVSEVSKFIDISSVQTYVINGAKIVFLNARPQRRLGKGVMNTCEICRRSLPDSFRFCSLGCKLDGMKTDQNLSFKLRPRPSTNFSSSDSGELSHPRKIRKKLSAFDGIMDFKVTSSDGKNKAHFSVENDGRDFPSKIWPETPPPVIEHRTSRRKGIPHRAPF